jgi:hypothetical protein
MKIPNSANLNEFEKNLLELNGKQVRAVRHEAESVKNCFTNQAHQAMVASATIAAVMASILKGAFDPYVVGLGALLISGLCISVSRVGCHKYNTANRVSGYQIHLSRVVDYEEAKPDRQSIAAELRRIDWEEAMFAWRVVQPKIFHFFYLERESLGICFKKNGVTGLSYCLHKLTKLIRKIFRRPEGERGRKRWEQAEAIRKYPWFDTNELVRTYLNDETNSLEAIGTSDTNQSSDESTDSPASNRKHDAKSSADIHDSAKLLASEMDYHPGTYLRKKLVQLHGIAGVSIALLIVCLAQIAPSLDIVPGYRFEVMGWILLVFFVGFLVMSVMLRKRKWPWDVVWLVVFLVSAIYLGLAVFVPAFNAGVLVDYVLFAFGVLAVLAFVRGVMANLWRCSILESGLLSIQTSAFVWRAVCICHLIAKAACKQKVREQESPGQLFNGYTVELHKASVCLRYHLHEVHGWLESREEELQQKLPPPPTTTTLPKKKKRKPQ